MTTERRAFSTYPSYLKTEYNDKITSIADDPLFEPESANFLNGYIGDFSILSEEDLERTPPILEMSPERQKYQLSVGSTLIDPDTQDRLTTVSYTDLERHLGANGALVDEPNRIFSTNFYAWTPPIDYDKHINFSRYMWTGPGSADVQGEYVTKEPSHSKTVIHEWDGSQIIARDVKISEGLPATGNEGDFVEDASILERFIFRHNGSGWVVVPFQTVSDIPELPSIEDFTPPLYFYVARTGHEFNRPLVWKYSDLSGRWISMPVIVNPVEPDNAREGAIWEDGISIANERTLKIFKNSGFIPLDYGFGFPNGTPGVDGEYLYDTRNYSDLTDDWSKENWWRHIEDLSIVDDEIRGIEDNATRPIIEFWNGIESVDGDTKDFRNESPLYKKYAVDPLSKDVILTTEQTTIFEFNQGTGRDDSVLGFPLSFNDDGEFLFSLTLEEDPSDFEGYHYYKDTNTGFIHGIWFKSDTKTIQEQDSNGLYDIPVGVKSNPNHDILISASRSRMLNHMSNIINSQNDFSGNQFGLNNYRWSEKNPAKGATLIDTEYSNLRVLSTLQIPDINIPDAIRMISREYNKTLFRFVNKLNQQWDNLTLTNGNNLLTVTPSEAVDSVLTSIFTGRTSDFPFFHSRMGSFLETIVTNGIASVIDNEPKPIFIAPSPPHVGAAQAFVPSSFVERDGTVVLRGHEGSIISSFGDERDLVWLE